MKIVLSESQVKRLIQENIEELNYQSLHDDENLQDLRDAIDKNKMVSVSFVKKDGEVKHMLVRKNLSSYVGSEREKTDAQMNVEMNHDLKKVVDINAYKRELKYLRNQNPEMDSTTIKQMASKKAWRSINLKNVLGFMVGGRFIDLRDENEIMDRFGETIYNSLSKSMINSMRAVEDNPEGDVNEANPGILGTLKSWISPSIQIVKNANNVAGYLKHIKPTSRPLMQKFGVLQNTRAVKQIMDPVMDTLPIIGHEFNKLKGQFVQTASAQNTVGKFQSQVSSTYKSINNDLKVAEGSTLNLSFVYKDLEELLYYTNRIKEEKILTTGGVRVINSVEAQIRNTLAQIDLALSKIAAASK
jgi:hypothetical protein